MKKLDSKMTFVQKVELIKSLEGQKRPLKRLIKKLKLALLGETLEMMLPKWMIRAADRKSR